MFLAEAFSEISNGRKGVENSQGKL